MVCPSAQMMIILGVIIGIIVNDDYNDNDVYGPDSRVDDGDCSYSKSGYHCICNISFSKQLTFI